MAQKIDYWQVIRKLTTVEMVGSGNEADGDILNAICTDCEQIIVHTLRGECRADEFFVAIIDHECGEEKKAPLLSLSTADDETDESELMTDMRVSKDAMDALNRFEGKALPHPSEKVMDALMKEITDVLKKEAQ